MLATSLNNEYQSTNWLFTKQILIFITKYTNWIVVFAPFLCYSLFSTDRWQAEERCLAGSPSPGPSPPTHRIYDFRPNTWASKRTNLKDTIMVNVRQDIVWRHVCRACGSHESDYEIGSESINWQALKCARFGSPGETTCVEVHERDQLRQLGVISYDIS